MSSTAGLDSTNVVTRWYKRPFDLAVLLTAHIVLLPLWIALWTLIPLAIWLQDRGPIFFRQKRLGRGGKEFEVLKFRTMIPDAEKYSGAVWSYADDPRITRIGRILRTTALDELPQVINILKGEMSFVGPRSERPELADEFAKEIPGFENRLQVRPGLTGLAQIKGSYDLHPSEKLRYDLEYINRMSLWLDIRIVMRSVLNTLLARWDKPTKDGNGPQDRDSE